MKGCALIGAALIVSGLLALVILRRTADRGFPPAEPVSAADAISEPSASTGRHAPAADHRGFLYGRITTVDGATHEGRLRFGGDQEAYWGDLFNGDRLENPWLPHLPPERLEPERTPVELFGIRLGERKKELDLGRPFVARFGEIARIGAHGEEVRVTLKSGSEIGIDRFGASDFDDGVRVWVAVNGVVDLDSLQIRSIELLPTPELGPAPYRLFGRVRTRQGEFSGFVAWRGLSLGTDELTGRAAEGETSFRFDTLRALARETRSSTRVTLLDGRELVLSGTALVGDGNGGVQVDDARFGRVLIGWETFERVDFGVPGPGDAGGSGPSYDDFAPGRPLTGSVTARDGRRFAGRLVYDLDESETSDTLDVRDRGIQYTVPFGQIASIAPPGRDGKGATRARLVLADGTELELDRSGDSGDGNAGLLVFVEGKERPDYLPWSDVERIELERTAALEPSPRSPP